MENEIKSRQLSLEELEKEYEETQKATQRYVKIAPSETKELNFTGNNTIRDVVFGSITKRMVDFELADIMPDQTHKTFSISLKNPLVKQITEQLKKGNKILKVHREGVGNETRYFLV